MVKADGYGLGAVRCAKAVDALNPWGLGVATVDEGEVLRAAGMQRPIVVFTPARSDEQARYRAADLRAVLDDPGVAAHWSLPFHTEIDTGMGRCGARWDDAARLAALGAAKPEGVFTHFHSADTDAASVSTQMQRFESAVKALGGRPMMAHAANSAGVFRLEKSGARPLDLVRPGIFLYGGSPGAGLPRPEPVSAVRARIVSLRQVPAGETVSYGAAWRAVRLSTVATLGVGYADGLARAAEGKASVLLKGTRCPIVGRVTMDLTMVDVTDIAGVGLGDVATVWGSDGAGAITLDECAGWSGTISYELLVRLGSRLERVYLEGG